MFCQRCGSPATRGARFCSSCGASLEQSASAQALGTAPLQSAPPRKASGLGSASPAIVPIAGIAITVLTIGGYWLWNTPTSTSAVEHHAADNTSILKTKAYDGGADFYFFDRCSMYIVVDGKKWVFPGEKLNDSCGLANSADAFREMQLTSASQ